jgi:hypothetical protein
MKRIDMATGFPFEYIGNVHIHTTHSDGGGGVKEVAEAARSASLDFIILNDHSYLTRLYLEDQGYHKGILVLVGSEIGTSSHHYLAFNIAQQVNDENRTPQEIINIVNSQGGFGFLAHPFEKGMHFLQHNVTYTWRDWSVKGYTGICIWNFSSRWKENIRSLGHGIFNLIFKKYTVKGPSKKTLATWDSLCSKRRVVAIGGSDAHASFIKIGFMKLKPLSYEYLLNTINTHILTSSPLSGDVTRDKEIIYSSLKEGNCFIAHDGLCNAKGFSFFFHSENNKKRLEMGEEGQFFPGVLVVQVPGYGFIRIIKDGSLFQTRYSGHLSINIHEGGVYRVEVLRKTPLFGWRPWIFSNPIYIRKEYTKIH